MPAILEKPARKLRSVDSTTTALVDEGYLLDIRMKRDLLRMSEIKTELVQKGPGEYYGTKADARALVIFPAPKIAPKPDVIPELEKSIGKPAFGTLFDRVVIWKPVKACRDVAMRVLTGAKLKKFFELSEADSPAQVRFG